MTEAGYPDIEALLPHRPPMVLLDRVVAHGLDSVTCALTLRADSPFVADGRVHALVTLEYMAQAAGVFAGLESLTRGAPVRPGFLIGCGELALAVDHLTVGESLLVTAHRVWGEARLGQFNASVKSVDGRVFATATLSVAQANREDLP